MKKGMIEIQSLGGGGFFIKSHNCHLLVDPYLGGSPKEGFIRREDPPVKPEDLTGGNLLLSTHCHGDHCDLKLIKFLEGETNCRFIGPQSSIDKMIAAGVKKERTEAVFPDDTLNFPGVEIEVHKGDDPKEEFAVIYVITMEGLRILHNGDCNYSEVYAQIGAKSPIDLAFLNYGKLLYMSDRDLLQAAADLHCKVAIPMHWDLYVDYYLPPEELMDKKADYPFDIRIIKPGECVQIPGWTAS